MTRLYVIIKPKGAKKYIGAIPAKPNSSVAKLRRLIDKYLRRGFIAKIITRDQLLRYMKKNTAKRVIKRKRPRSVSKRLNRSKKRRG